MKEAVELKGNIVQWSHNKMFCGLYINGSAQADTVENRELMIIIWI
jgi:hypothetical protein